MAERIGMGAGSLPRRVAGKPDGTLVRLPAAFTAGNELRLAIRDAAMLRPAVARPSEVGIAQKLGLYGFGVPRTGEKLVHAEAAPLE